MLQLKQKREYKLEDLNSSDLNHLFQAAGLPPKTWYCFGNSYAKLAALGLVDDDNSVTWKGKELLINLSNLQ